MSTNKSNTPDTVTAKQENEQPQQEEMTAEEKGIFWSVIEW